jgi:hypothetical protein
MEQVDAIFRRLNANEDLGGIRLDIANLIAEQLERKRDSLGYWEKAHFAHAIAALGWNMKAQHQPTPAWLRLCLVDLEKALVPADQRNEHYTPRDEQLDSLTYDQLRRAIEMLGGQAPRAL